MGRVKPFECRASRDTLVFPGEDEIDLEVLRDLLYSCCDSRIPNSRRVKVTFLRRNPHVDYYRDRPDLPSSDEADLHYEQPICVLRRTLEKWYRKIVGEDFSREKDLGLVAWESRVIEKRASFGNAVGVQMWLGDKWARGKVRSDKQGVYVRSG